MANKIQLRRDTTANWNNVNPILADGEPGLDITTNQVKYGDGANAWVDLSYASGGAGLTDVNGLVTFPGDFLIGTLWPEDPMPEGDKESVVWAKDDTEYLGLWWGGSQTYPNIGYGPVAGIMIGTGDEGGSMTDDFTSNASPEFTNITIAINDSVGDTNSWVFDRTGNLTLPDGGVISETSINSAYSILLTPSPIPGENPDMAVKIYPTFVDDDHIHITAGNVATVDLFLGDDDQYVKIEKNAGNVVIGANADTYHWTFGTDGNLTLPEGGTLNSNPYVPAGAGFTMSAIELQTNTSSQAVVGIDNILTSGFEYTFFDNAEWYAQIVQAGEAVGPYRSVPVTWAAGSTRSSGFVLVQFTGGNSFGITPAAEGGGSADPGTWYFPATFGNPSSAVQGGILLTANSNVWKFGTDGNLTLPAGGNIKDSTGTSVLDRISVTGSSAVLTKDQYNTSRLTFTGNANIETAGYLTGAGGLALVDSSSQQYVIVKPDRVQINTGFPDQGTGLQSYNEWQFLKSGVFKLPTTGIIENSSKQWTFGTDGNLTLPAGGEIHSSSGTGAVAVQSNDGSNNFNWNFTTHGSITMPELLSGAQGYGSLDANNNKIALTTSDTVNFAGFSGMILVNTHNGGGVSLYLCGGGSGSAIAIGDSKTGNSVGSMAFNAGIAGYTFTADETGDHVFFAIRTRTGG